MNHVVIAIDCDGTIMEHRYPHLGSPVPGAFEWMKKFQEAGAKLVLYTMRSGKELDEAVKYCKNYGITFWGVNTNPEQKEWTDSPKTWAHIYIDDHALFCPLLQPDKFQRAFADWSKIGPEVMKHINERMGR
jgi:hypothetical protein